MENKPEDRMYPIVTNSMQNKSTRLLPINLVCIYLIITMVLYMWGPRSYNPRNPILTFLYLSICTVLLYLGYHHGVKKSNSKDIGYSKILQSDSALLRRKRRTFDILLIIYVLLIPLTLYSRTGSFWFDFSSFKNLGQVYSLRAQNNTNLTIEWLRIILSPVILSFIPYSIINRKYLNKFRILLFIIGIVSAVMVDITSGVNKSFADAIIFCFIFFLVSIGRKDPNRNDSNSEKKTRKKVKRIFIITILVLLIFFMFFSATILSRTQSDSNDYSKALDYFCAYLTQGYRAVDYSLTQPFTSTYGFGSSMYLLDSTQNWFHTSNIIQRSYLYKNQMLYGLDYKLSWSSLYVWMANDVSMLGVLPVMYLIGYVFGKVWRQLLDGQNHFSALVVAGLMFQLCMYIPANNQIVQTAESLFGTLFWLIIWLLSNSKKKIVLTKR